MSRVQNDGTAAANLREVSWDRVAGLEWRQPRRLARVWELMADGEPAAMMTWRGPWKRGFVARVASREWIVSEPFLAPMSIAPAEGEAFVVRTRPGWFGAATLERAAGESLRWRRENWLRRTFVTANAEGFPLLRTIGRREFLRFGAAVELEEAARRLPDLEALVLIGWALVLASARNHHHG